MPPFEGKADALYEQPGDIARLLAAQQLRPVLAFNAARLPSLPEVPPSQELGFGQGFDQFRAIVVRAGTAPARVKVLSDSLDKLAGSPEYRQFLKEAGAAPASYVPARDVWGFLQWEPERSGSVAVRRLHRDGHVPKVRIAVSSPLHRHAFPPSDAHEPLQVPRKAVRAGSPAGLLSEEFGAALSAARWHEVALTAWPPWSLASP